MKQVVTKEDFINSYKYHVFAEYALERYEFWFPVLPSIKLAEIAADLMTDGHIETRIVQKHLHYDYTSFFSKNNLELERFNKNVYDLFNVKGEIKKWGIRKNGSSTGCIIYNAALSRVLRLCGVPTGSKVNSPYLIPTWIMTSGKDIKSAFLRRSFTCEGCITRSNCRWEIKYSMSKSVDYYKNGVSYLNMLRDILKKDFGIETSNIHIIERSERKDGAETVCLRFRIMPQSFYDFARKINFDLEYKKERLNLLLNGPDG